jgi:cytochrome P450
MEPLIKDDLDSLLTSPAFVQDPYPVFDRLRDTDPVYWSDAWNCWVVTSYEDVVGLFKDVAHFSNRNRFDALFAAVPPDVRGDIQPLETHYTGIGLIHSDPPDHTRLRKLIHMAFTPRVIREMRESVQNIVDRHLDKVQADGQMDALWDLAFPLPATVIAIMLGVPLEHIDKLKSWTVESLLFQATGRASESDLKRSQTALLEMKDYLRTLVRARRAEPADDLLTALVQAEDAGDKLTEDELLSTCVTLMVAGHETTTNLIANGLLTMLRNPDILTKLRENRALIPDAVEEFLRLESPIQRNRRVISSDFEYKGHVMRKGEAVLQMLGAANRDPRQFERPAEFDATRNPNPHISFGLGIHFCLGAPLARLEAPIAFNSLFDRFPNLQLATDTVEWQPGVMRSLSSLPVRF